MDSKLEIISIWEDEDLFEVKVIASNGSFSGISDCYTNREEIAKLSEDIDGFPKSIDQEVCFTTGEREDLSYFSLFFKCRDGAGHVVLRVKVAHIVSYTNTAQVKDISEFDIQLEASAIDAFARSLNALSKSKLGSVNAILLGKT